MSATWRRLIRQPWPVSRLLILFVGAPVLPILFLITWEGYRFADQVQKELKDQAAEIANRISSDLDQTLANYITILQTLATSPALARNDLATVYEQARTAFKSAGLFAFLYTPDGRQVFNTRMPFGTPLPRPAFLEEAPFTNKEPFVSNVIVGNVAKKPLIVVSVPVTENDKLTYVLSLTVDVGLLKDLLGRQQLPSQWTVGIADRKRIIIARSRRNDEFQGKPIPREDLLKFGVASAPVVDMEGRKVLLARSLSRLAGWSVAAAVPVQTIDATVSQALSRFLAVVGMMAALGIFGALQVGRLITRPLYEVKKAAEALGKGEQIPLHRSSVAEAQAAIDALLRSAEQRDTAMERFMEAGEGAGALVYDFDLAANHLWRSNVFTRMLGWKQNEVPPTFEGWLGLLHLEDRELLQQLKVNEQDRYAVEVRIRHRDGHYLWVWDRGRVFRDKRGAIVRRVGSIIDITLRKTLEQQQALLLRELSHRSKNLIGVIQAVSRQTLASSRSTSEARDALSARLQSLARTYDTLTRNPTHDAPLAKIVRDELGAFGARAEIGGPDFFLNPTAAQTIALIVHELATNAVKYGSLSVPQGAVRVLWGEETHGGTRHFYFSWRECGGPRVNAPDRLGFGSILTEEIAGRQFEGKVSRKFLESGLDYQLIAPLSNLTTEP